MKFLEVQGIEAPMFRDILQSFYDKILIGTDNKYYVLPLRKGKIDGVAPRTLEEYFSVNKGLDDLISFSPGNYSSAAYMQNVLKLVMDKVSLAKAAKFRYRITADLGDLSGSILFRHKLHILTAFVNGHQFLVGG